MAALSGAKLQNIINTTLINHIRGAAFESSIQERPLLKRFRGSQKKFAAGRDTISERVKGGAFTIGFTSFTNDDTVTYGDTNRIQPAQYVWREYHAGIQLTVTELKQSGFVVGDTAMGLKASKASDSDKSRLTDLLDDKMTDMSEGILDSLNTQIWENGTASATDMLGITGLITDLPSVGTVGGIVRSVATNAYWRNLAFTIANSSAITSSPLLGGALLTQIQIIMRQLLRFKGKPSLALCGSDFLQAMESEFRANGNYSLDGFSNGGDVSVGGMRWKNIDFMYDPTLDGTVGGANRSKFCYLLDERHIRLRVLDGDDFATHAPANPLTQYTLHKAVTWSGAVTANRFNVHAVLEIT